MLLFWKSFSNCARPRLLFWRAGSGCCLALFEQKLPQFVCQNLGFWFCLGSVRLGSVLDCSSSRLGGISDSLLDISCCSGEKTEQNQVRFWFSSIFVLSLTVETLTVIIRALFWFGPTRSSFLASFNDDVEPTAGLLGNLVVMLKLTDRRSAQFVVEGRNRSRPRKGNKERTRGGNGVIYSRHVFLQTESPGP